MKLLRICLLLVVLFVSSCTGGPGTPAVSSGTATQPPATPTPLASPSVMRTSTPDAQSAARAFLDAWKAEDYAAMYNMLTPLSRDVITADDFALRYRDTALNLTLKNLDYEILSTLTNPTLAQVAYRIIFHTNVFPDFSKDMNMGLSLEKGVWLVQWEDGMIMPELRGGNRVAISYDSPARGNIYDSGGNGMAIYSDVMALGVVVGETNENQTSTLLSELSRLTGKTPEAILALYDNDYTYPGTYVAIGEASRDEVMDRYNILSGLSGLYLNEYSGRYYPDGGVGPHVTGYVSAIQAGEQDQYLRAGFQIDDRVGRSGLEFWGQNYLLGQRGATLDVYDLNGSPVTRLARVERKPSQSIYTTINSNLQLEAQKALAGFNGGLVVMERDSGRVLAMVSSPGFDPNAFEFLNYNSGPLLGQILGDSLNREYNRAAGNGYPLGSVFKIITMAAALESGVFTPESTYECGHFYTELTGWTLEDWTYAKGFNPSGNLTLPEGLMRSCNPWFYHIGYELYSQNRTKDVSNMARAFGLGSPTGIEGISEEAGNIPDPNEIGMAVQMAIGQSEILVNPLQVARFIAAIGNGGTLYKPQLIEKIVDPDNNPSFTFQSQAQGTLPVKPENLTVIQDAMRSVVASPRGTAVRAFSGLSIPVYGKTGTAQNDWPGHPHAWFAGYTDAGRADRPDIAVAVVAEYAGEGSEIAAYIYRRIIEIYFMGQPQAIYPWEARLNVTRTPTLDVTLTPEPPGGGSSGSSGGSGDSGGGFSYRTATPSQ